MTAEERAAAFTSRWFPGQGEPSDPSGWDEVRQGIDRAVDAGDQDFLFALHDACGAHPLLRQSWPRQAAWRAAGLIEEASALRRFLERAKTPPSSELLLTTKQEPSDAFARSLGAMLANAHDDSLLERELEHFGLDPELCELFACWIHERIARGSPLGRSAFVQHFLSALPPGHPLAALPLELRPLEAGLLVQSARRADPLGDWFEFGPLERDGFGPEGTSEPKVQELPVDAGELAAVAADAAIFPNTVFEARTFRLLTRPPSLRATSLQPLRLECLMGHPAAVRACSARHALQLLLMLGINGVYARARSAAHGRALAWRSMTTLVGLPRETPLAEVEAEAARTEWLSFESKSPWFLQMTLDGGLVSLRADGTLAVLAVTSTD